MQGCSVSDREIEEDGKKKGGRKDPVVIRGERERRVSDFERVSLSCSEGSDQWGRIESLISTQCMPRTQGQAEERERRRGNPLPPRILDILRDVFSLPFASLLSLPPLFLFLSSFSSLYSIHTEFFLPPVITRIHKTS